MLVRDEVLSPVRSLSSWIIVYELYKKTFNWTRPWNDYKIGFGQLGSDYWFGLEKLHKLTAAGAVRYKLRMESRLISKSNSLYIEMADFSIGDEASYYQLTWSGMTSSDKSMIGRESQSYHIGKMFSTYDNNSAYDIDNHRSCPELCGGGWWYDSCYVICPTCFGNLGYCPSGGSSFNIARDMPRSDFTRMMIATA